MVLKIVGFPLRYTKLVDCWPGQFSVISNVSLMY